MTVLHIPSCALFSCTEKCYEVKRSGEHSSGTGKPALKWRQLFPTSETSNLPIMQAQHAFIFLISELLKALSRKGLMATRYLQQLILRKDTDVLYLRKNSLHHFQLYPSNNSLLTGLSSEFLTMLGLLTICTCVTAFTVRTGNPGVPH